VVRLGKFVTAIVIAAIFLSLTADGLHSYFAPDDMMNIYGYWSRSPAELLTANLMFFRDTSRPMAAIFYYPLFTLFGLNPLPYRVVCLALLLANLLLLYAFSRLVSRSGEIGALACVIGAYHAHLADLYYNVDTIYDLLCFFFYFATFVYYLKIRERDRYPSVPAVVGLWLLYVCALNSKEMAVSLPCLIGLYELVYHPPKYTVASIRSWLICEARLLWPMVPTTAAYLIGKMAGPNRMTANPDYYPYITLRVLTKNWQHYLYDLLYGYIEVDTSWVPLLFASLLSLALAARSRDLVFSWFMITIGALPVVFIAPRGLFVLYVTLPGWYLYAARCLVMLRDWLFRVLKADRLLKPESGQIALFVGTVALLIPLHLHQREWGRGGLIAAQVAARAVPDQLARTRLTMRRGARVLFLSDPYPVDDWILTFTFRLYYRDKEIEVDRAKVLAARPRAPASCYDHVFKLDNWVLTEVSANSVPRCVP